MQSKSTPTMNITHDYRMATRTSTNSGSTWTAWSYQAKSATSSGVKITLSETTPNYKQKLKDGALIPPTRFIQTELSTLWEPTTWNTVFKNSTTARTEVAYPDGYFGVGTGAGPWPSLVLTDYLSSSLPDVAVRAASADINGLGIDGLTFFAELVKTRRMILTICQRIVNLRHKWDELYQLFMSVPGLWLEARFGLRPLIGDLFSINDQLRRANRMQSEIYTKTRNVSASLTIPKYEASTVSSSININTTVDYDCFVAYRGCVATRMVNAGFNFNPIATAWELVPFSFIVDWLIDIGSTIMAAQQLFLAKETVASKGWKIYINETRRKYISPVAGGNYLVATGGAACTVKSMLTERQPCSVNLMPSMRLNIDAFKAIDAWMLLISQMLGGKTGSYKNPITVKGL